MIVTISTLPISPAATRRFTAAKLGSKRRLKPIISGVPAASHDARGRRGCAPSVEVDRLLAEHGLAGLRRRPRSGRHACRSACRSARRRCLRSAMIASMRRDLGARLGGKRLAAAGIGVGDRDELGAGMAATLPP